MFILLTLLVLSILLWVIFFHGRTIFLVFTLIAFLVVSTEAFYRILFVRNAILNKDSPCTVIVSNGGDIAEPALLLTSAKELGLTNIYLLSLVPDTTLSARLNTYFSNDQNSKIIASESLSEEKFKRCLYIYPPHIFCSVINVKNKYTLLPHEMSSYIPNGKFLSINTDAIDHCVSVIIDRKW